jgi:hypothetical protein
MTAESLTGWSTSCTWRRDNEQPGRLSMLVRSAAVTAVGLLTVLVIHLAYMVSPLHAMMVTEHPDSREMLQGDFDGRVVEAAQAADHGRDCTIEWTTSTQTLILILPPALLEDSIAALFASQLPVPPIARALGPPRRGDPQALLQVFRL